MLKFTHSSAGSYLGLFHFLAVVNRTVAIMIHNCLCVVGFRVPWSCCSSICNVLEIPTRLSTLSTPVCLPTTCEPLLFANILPRGHAICIVNVSFLTDMTCKLQTVFHFHVAKNIKLLLKMFVVHLCFFFWEWKEEISIERGFKRKTVSLKIIKSKIECKV